MEESKPLGKNYIRLNQSVKQCLLLSSQQRHEHFQQREERRVHVTEYLEEREVRERERLMIQLEKWQEVKRERVRQAIRREEERRIGAWRAMVVCFKLGREIFNKFCHQIEGYRRQGETFQRCKKWGYRVRRLLRKHGKEMDVRFTRDLKR